MCLESRNIFSCGCQKPKHGNLRVRLCALAAAKGSECPISQTETCIKTSSMFNFPCLACMDYSAKSVVEEKMWYRKWVVPSGCFR